MLVSKEVRENYPFPAVLKKPTKLAIKLQERIKYMFGITVEPVIIRQKVSYKKTEEFGHLWEMVTSCCKYSIASRERAKEMAKKSSWKVLDFDLFKAPDNEIKITKLIF